MNREAGAVPSVIPPDTRKPCDCGMSCRSALTLPNDTYCRWNHPGRDHESAKLQAVEEVKCRACGYTASIETYLPCFSVYNDIRCPECGSTNNQHNSDYQARLREGMKSW